MATGSGDSKLSSQYPLHADVWNNDIESLTERLQSGLTPIEAVDPRGRTPLMLAVTLNHIESARILLGKGADACAENKNFWSVSHEAAATGYPELLQLILHYREFQRATKTKEVTANLLHKLADTPDFYAEMSWEFSSWVPFVSKMCPSDTYKVYKSGSFVRVDATLIGFDENQQWQRGNQSYLFKGSEDGRSMEVIIVDHDSQAATRDAISLDELEETEILFSHFRPSEMDISNRLTSPIVTTFIDVDKIAFERPKAGFLSWKDDKEENVNGYAAKVFSASNVELVTKTRKEHMSQRDRDEIDNRNSTPMDSLLKFVQGSETKHEDKVNAKASLLTSTANPNNLTLDEYLDPSVDLLTKRGDIGRPKEMTRRAQNFKATLWLAENFPLSLQEQITPIIDLMAVNNAHFQRLKNFIQLQLPAGFPVKIEIPLFYVINARITFGNINANTQPIPKVSVDGDKVLIAPEIFDVPASYTQHDSPRLTSSSRRRSQHRNAERSRGGAADDDLILQWAIQQSLLEEQRTEGIEGGEGGGGGGLPPFSLPNEELDNGSVIRSSSGNDHQLQRAIQASLGIEDNAAEGTAPPTNAAAGVNEDSMMARILAESAREEDERQKRLQSQEEEDLKRIIELSLTEK